MIKLSNQHRILQTLGMLAFLVLSLSRANAQSRAAETNTIAGNEEIHGTVKFPAGDASGRRATVTLQSMGQPEVKVQTDSDGQFRFTHLRPDHYKIIVDAGEAYEKATETVSVGFSGAVPAQGNPFGYIAPEVSDVRIYLQPRGAASSEAATPKISGSAKKHFRQAMEDARAGNHTRAIENFNLVIAEAPSFKPAYLELGTEYLKSGNGQMAIETFKAALAIDPDDSALLLNYGIALLNQKEYSAAETQLRLAIRNSKDYSVSAHYYLGVALLIEKKIDEARTVLEEIVKNGGDKLPLVHRYLGGIYLQDKQYARAADELDKYLDLEPKASDSEKIREMARDARSKS